MSEEMVTKIISAAQEILSRHGPEGLTMEATADRARVARKTVYNYFTTKHNLIRAVRLQWMQGVIAELTAIAESANLQIIDKINHIVEKGFGYLKNAGRLLDRENLRQTQKHEALYQYTLESHLEDKGSSDIENMVSKSLFMLIYNIVSEAVQAGFIIEDFNAERITWMLINIIGGLLYLDFDENHFTKYDLLRDSLKAVIRGMLTQEGYAAMQESPLLTGRGIA